MRKGSCRRLAPSRPARGARAAQQRPRDGLRRESTSPAGRALPMVELMTATITADDLATTLHAAAADSDFSGVIRVDQGGRLVAERA